MVGFVYGGSRPVLDLEISNPTRYAGASRTWRSTPARNASRSDAGGPSLRAAGFEDEDEDEAPGEGVGLSESIPGTY